MEREKHPIQEKKGLEFNSKILKRFTVGISGTDLRVWGGAFIYQYEIRIAQLMVGLFVFFKALPLEL